MSDLFVEIHATVYNEDKSEARFTIHARPCPFCGSKPQLECLLRSGKWFLECSGEDNGCLAPMTEPFRDPGLAAAQWNRRVLNG